jgi:hypothetical protein
MRFLRLLRLTLLIAVLFTSVWGASHTRAQSNSYLAEYAPTNTAVYLESRIDRDFLTTLDQLLAAGTELTPNAAPAPSLVEQINAALAMLDYSYEEDIEPWLGEHVALYLSDIDQSEPGQFGENATFAVLVESTDAEAAEAFIRGFLGKVGNGRVPAVRTEGDYTIFEEFAQNANPEVSLAVGGNVILLGTETAVEALVAGEGGLSEESTFVDAMNAMPEEAYNLRAFINTPLFVELAIQQSMGATIPPVIQESLDALGATVFGATLLPTDNGTALTLDILQLSTMSMAPEAVDLEFARYIPQDAAFVLHGTNLAGQFDTLLTTLRENSDVLNTQSFEEQYADFLTLFERLTELNFETDVIGWMTGDFALVTRYNAPQIGSPSLTTTIVYPNEPVPFDVDQALVIEATDAQAAANMVEKLGEALPLLLGSTEGIALDELPEGGFEITIDTPTYTEPIRIVVASNEDVLVIGTSNIAQEILAGDGALNQSPVFETATSLFLPEPTSVLYMGESGFTLLADAQAQQSIIIGRVFDNVVAGLSGTPTAVPSDPDAQLEADRQQLAEFQEAYREAYGTLFESASITATTVEGESMLLRAVLTVRQ